MVSYGAPRVDILKEFFAGEAEDDIRAHVDVEDRLKRMAGLIESLESREAAEQAVLAGLRDTMEKVKDLLVRHASKEDEVLFPMVARLLSKEQVAAITTRLRDLCSGMDDSGD
jgi:iron-sulfur cluster repair protein YtfE (RIC family)